MLQKDLGTTLQATMNISAVAALGYGYLSHSSHCAALSWVHRAGQETTTEQRQHMGQGHFGALDTGKHLVATTISHTVLCQLACREECNTSKRKPSTVMKQEAV